MPQIKLENIAKKYSNNTYVVKDFNLDINDKDFVIFVGPSGCGKSTTLRMIAGLEEISEGELWIDGELYNYIEPKDRNMSMVFQNYALYPHMTVYDNIAFSLKIRKLDKKTIKEKVHNAAKILDIEHLLKRKPKDLSGGQKQRVAIGSSIVRNPKLFLMDEPLSNLDAKLRSQMRVELAKLHKDLGATIVYVTHDQTEAMTLGTKIVVMKDGLIQQIDSPIKLYNNPINLFVAGFIGEPSMNFLECYVKKEDGKIALYLGDINSFKKVYINDYKKIEVLEKYVGKSVILGIRPEYIYEYKNAIEKGIEKNTIGIEETVTVREVLGSEVILYFKLNGKNFSIKLSQETNAQVGENMELYFDTNKIHIFDKETEQNIFFVKE